jgi:hypothetical protein
VGIHRVQQVGAACLGITSCGIPYVQQSRGRGT